MICRSAVRTDFFINNPDPELRLKPDPDKKFFKLPINNTAYKAEVAAGVSAPQHC
jgi:hypothetical protein